MSAAHSLGGRVALLGRAAWLPIPVLVVATLVLRQANLPGSHFAPRLVLALQFVFMTLASALVVYLISRSFLARGSVGLLLLDAGIVFWGLSGVVAGAVSHGDVNVSVTVHNLSVWLSALCHAIGVVLHEPRRTLRNGGWWLFAMFTCVLAVITTIVGAATTGLIPTFFIQGRGGTPVRQVVLGSAVAMFVFSALVLRAKDRGESSPFARWYYLGLLLMATGLIGVLIQTAHSSVLGWMGMATQWLSGPYLVIAALAAARESNAWEISLAATPNDVRLRYCMAALLVIAAAIVQLVAVPESGARIVYVTFFPAVMLAAVYGGRGPGILAAVLSTIIIDVYWIEPIGQFDVRDVADKAGVTFFLGSSVAVALTIAAMQKAQARAVSAEAGLVLAAERQRGEEALRVAHAELAAHTAQLERLVEQRTAKLNELVGDLEAFSYSIVHDMRAPLRAMQGFSQVLAEECGPLSPQADDCVRRISTAAARMDRLIQDGFNYGRLMREDLPLTPTDPEALLRGMIETYPTFQPPSASVRIEGQFPLVQANEAGLTQCVSNLLGNAVKFVAPGVIPEVRVWAESGGGRVRLLFQDNGIGMSKDAHRVLFRIFQRLGTDYEGTGVGLAIVKKAAERMGGRVGFESELGRGSTFWVELAEASDRSA